MTPEAKKQLEEMANSYPAYYEMRFMNADTPRLSGAEYLVHGYKAGAQAAWDLAVKHERERNYRLMLTYFGECFDEVIIETPAPPQQGE